MDLDERFTDVLTKHRLLIIQHLQMDRTFLFDYLISKSSFDKTDFELIQAEKTSESKAGRFLDILGMKGESAFYHFLDALQILNPNLYEMLTGESATKRTNPIFSDMKSHLTCGGGSSYLDLDILSNFSRRLSEDLQDLTLRYEQVLKEKNELRRKLEDALAEQTRKQRRIESLEKQVSDTEEALVTEAQSSASKAGENLLQRFQVVQREGRTNQFIIQLQMKLLTAHEENETLRKQLEDFRGSNNELLKQLSKVNEDYAFKKRETFKLSQQLKSQSAEMKSCESLKQKLREVQFQNGKLRCELQEKENEVLELTEVKHWTEALKARFDLIVAEKEQVLKNHEVVENKCTLQRDEISDLKVKLNHKERDMEELRRSHKELEDSSRIYREERDFYCRSLKDAALELEQMRKESEEIAQRHKKTLESKESSIRQQAEYVRQFETKYEETKDELASVKLKLNQEREKNEELRKKISNMEEDLQQKESALKSYLEEEDESQNVNQIQDPHKSEPNETENDHGLNFDWTVKEREPKELVGSIIRRFETTSRKKTKENRANDRGIRKSMSFDEKLAKLVPEFESLPIETQQGCSLDRHRMKQSLPYELLAAIYQPMRSITSSFPDDLSAAVGSSRDSSNAINMRGDRKMSAPAMSNYFSLGRQDSNTARNTGDEREDKEAESSLVGDEVKVFEDKPQDLQHEFRARTRAIRLKNGERRQRRLTEPVLFSQDFSRTEHL